MTDDGLWEMERGDLIRTVRAMASALAPFARNAWVLERGRHTYGDGPVFQRITLDENGDEAVWSFTIDDVTRANQALGEVS